MSDKKVTKATQLVELALATDGLELFHDADGSGFVTIPQGTHNEHWPLRGGPFRRWLARLFFEQERSAPGQQSLQDALGVLEGIALFEGQEHEVHLRLAEHEGVIYLDLVDEFWQAIAIGPAGWEVVHAPPVRFRRARGMRPLPYPVDGALEELREFVNVSDEDWPLFAAWTVAALRPRGPFPVAALHGEQGSAKSTTARVLRELIDPNEAPLRSEPRDGHDLMIAARNGWLVALDNVSHLAPWLSDSICRLATGGGFATRQLYTDTDEVLIDVQRPVLMNGIAEVGTRADLLDRSVILYLPRISDYRPEETFWAAFEQARARILGGLLDAVATALSNVNEVTIARPPRMADFALWAVAAEPALGLPPGAFLDAYEGNRASAVQLTLESSPLVAPLETVAAEGFEGTASELLDRLVALVDEATTRKKGWPGAPHVLSGHLRRLAPALRRVGIEVEFKREGAARRIVVRTGPQSSVTSVTERHNGVVEPNADDARSAGDDANDANDASLRTHSTQAELEWR